MSLAAGIAAEAFPRTIRAAQSRAVSRGALRVCQLEAYDSGHSGVQHLRDLIAGLLGFHIAAISVIEEMRLYCPILPPKDVLFARRSMICSM